MHSALSPRDQRLIERKSKDQTDLRTPAQRDRDRLLYSSAFRRLAEVTQVVSANSGYVFHNRLTHSLQVAQVARRLAEKLNRDYLDVGLFDPDVVEAASLAHDIGHPPFGHIAEECLNDLASSIGGFEGNAQSFRIVCKLAFHSPEYEGLNLTRATLCAMLKYPWLKDTNPDKRKKWGAYLSEKTNLDFARQLYPHEFEPCPEAVIMDWADDITYCVHDLEDFYRAGRLPLHLLAAEESKEVDYFFDRTFERRTELITRRDELQQIFRELVFLTFSSMQPYRGTEAQRASLRRFTGALIGRYINAITLDEQDGRWYPRIDRQYKDEILMLKELTWTYVINEPALATQQVGQQHMIRRLFEVYSNASGKPSDRRVFPAYYRERLKKADSSDERLRACIDLIAGMTEVQVQRLYARVNGLSLDSSLNDPLT